MHIEYCLRSLCGSLLHGAKPGIGRNQTVLPDGARYAGGRHAAILNHASWLINPGLTDVLHG